MFFDDVIKNIMITPDRNLKMACPVCGEEVTSQMRFPNSVKDLFKYAVVCVVDGNDTVVGFTNNEIDTTAIEGDFGKMTLVSSAKVSELPYISNIMLLNVRDAELPTIVEMFTYTILGWDDTEEDEGETLIGFTDSTELDHTVIWDFDYFELIDNVSGKRQVPTIKEV